MDYFRRLEPTPFALRNGRLVTAALAVIVAVILALMVLVSDLGDPGLLAITAATIVTLAGHAIAYLGQPTLSRYRLGLIVAGVGIVAAFGLLLANPFPAISN